MTTSKATVPQGKTRTQPMKVLVLGMCRTGTLSMRTALEEIGLHTYHPARAWDNAEETFGLWNKALQAKYYGRGKSWERQDFDQLLGEYQAVTDVPCAIFVDELIASYPEAKVVLTIRDADKWLDSMHRTIFKAFSWPSWRLLQYLGTGDAGLCYSHTRLIFQGWCDNDYGEKARQRYLEHNEHVRASVPEGNLLEYKPGDGWEPLCEFLDIPVPGTPFPNVNDSDYFMDSAAFMWRVAVQRAFKSVGRAVLPVAAVGASYYIYNIMS